jgi:hypothetical protein
MNTVTLPALSAGQEASWLGLLEVSRIVPDQWSLIGGQMVQLHCWERGARPVRITNDVDTVLDVRARPEILFDFTSALRGIGFVSNEPTRQEHQYRWVRGKAIIDVLIPRNLGERASLRKGISGGTTLETIGGQGALDSSEKIQVHIGDESGIINRPSLVGALAIKAAAYSNPLDVARDRHLEDIAVLSTLLSSEDVLGDLSSQEKARIQLAVVTLAEKLDILSRIENSREGLERLRLVVF